VFEGKGKMMRHVKFYSLKDVDEARVVKLLRLVAEKGLVVEHVFEFSGFGFRT
jgi:hypothetical protein